MIRNPQTSLLLCKDNLTDDVARRQPCEFCETTLGLEGKDRAKGLKEVLLVVFRIDSFKLSMTIDAQTR